MNLLPHRRVQIQVADLIDSPAKPPHPGERPITLEDVGACERRRRPFATSSSSLGMDELSSVLQTERLSA